MNLQQLCAPNPLSACMAFENRSSVLGIRKVLHVCLCGGGSAGLVLATDLAAVHIRCHGMAQSWPNEDSLVVDWCLIVT